MKCSIKTGKSYNDLWCDYRDLSYLEEIRASAVKLTEQALRETINQADKLSKLGRTAQCYYEDNLNIHYYLELLTIFRRDIDDYIFNCGCLTQSVLDLFINKYQIKCPINPCNVDHTLFRKMYQLFIPAYGYCNDTICLDWGVETECLCESAEPSEPVITINIVENTSIDFSVNHTGVVLEINIINAETNLVLQSFTTSDTNFVLTDLELSTLYTIQVSSVNCAGKSSTSEQIQTLPIKVTVVIDNPFSILASSNQLGETVINYDSNFPVEIVINNAGQPSFINSNTVYITTLSTISDLTTTTRQLTPTGFYNGLPTSGTLLLQNVKYNALVTLKVTRYVSIWNTTNVRCVTLNGANTGDVQFTTLSTSYNGVTILSTIPNTINAARLFSYLTSNNVLSSIDLTTLLVTQRVIEDKITCPVLDPISVVEIIPNLVETDNYLTFDLSGSTDGNLIPIGTSDQVTHTIKIFDSSNNLVYSQNFIPTIPTVYPGTTWYANTAYISIDMNLYLLNDFGTLEHTITYELQSGNSITNINRYPVSIQTVGNVSSNPPPNTYWFNAGLELFVLAESDPDPITSITVNGVLQTVTDINSTQFSFIVSDFTTVIIQG
jgi:hypothetical protein